MLACCSICSDSKSRMARLQGSTGYCGLRTRELLQHLLETLCRLSPTVMLIEDTHWIDSASEELLKRIIDGTTARRLLLLTTRRPEYSPPWLDRSVVANLRL